MSFSLDASLRTCKVEAGQASRIESDRFLNPTLMVCPTWNGMNLKGQVVCADSFYTKSAGCNSAEDRVLVENDQRPKYAAYLNLNLSGVQGDIYGNKTAWDESGARNAWDDSRNQLTGQFGNQFGSTNYMSCNNYGYEKAMADEAEANRMAAYTQNAYTQNAYYAAGNNY